MTSSVDAKREAYLNLRDQFAMATLQGLLASPNGPIIQEDGTWSTEYSTSYSDISEFCYEVAETMMRERAAWENK